MGESHDHPNRCIKSTIQNPTLFHDRNAQQIRYWRKLPQHNKNILKTPNLVLNGGKTKSFSSKSRTRQECPLSPLLFNIILELQLGKKKFKDIQIGKKEINVLFAGNMMHMPKTLRIPPNNCKKKITNSVNLQSIKLVVFIYTNNKLLGVKKKKPTKQSHL